MEQSRQRKAQIDRNKKFIIESKKNWFREIIVAIISLIVWIYSIIVVCFFIDAILGLDMELTRRLHVMFEMSANDIVDFTSMIGILFILIFISLYGWNFYNKKRYGNLDRRVYPSTADKEDMMSLNMLDEDTYDVLQDVKIISFELNPVKRKTTTRKIEEEHMKMGA